MSTRHQTSKYGWFSCCRAISSFFQKIHSHSPIMSSVLPMGATYERVFASDAHSRGR